MRRCLKNVENEQKPYDTAAFYLSNISPFGAPRLDPSLCLASLGFAQDDILYGVAQDDILTGVAGVLRKPPGSCPYSPCHYTKR